MQQRKIRFNRYFSVTFAERSSQRALKIAAPFITHFYSLVLNVLLKTQLPLWKVSISVFFRKLFCGLKSVTGVIFSACNFVLMFHSRSGPSVVTFKWVSCNL
jgi:hypothetical protein